MWCADFLSISCWCVSNQSFLSYIFILPNGFLLNIHETCFKNPSCVLFYYATVLCSVLSFGEYYDYLSLCPALPSAKHHLSYDDCLEVKREYFRTAVCWIVWHNVHSLQHTYMSSSYRSNRLGLSRWDPYAVHRGDCLELYYCNMVEWFWWDSSLILTTNWFPSVLWHCCFGHLACKNHPKMTYNVLSGMLSLYATTTTIMMLCVGCSFIVVMSCEAWHQSAMVWSWRLTVNY